MRYRSLIRMLNCPSLSPESASRRFPGGILRSSSEAAISSWRNLRRAMRSNDAKRFTRTPRAKRSVSRSLYDTIIVSPRINNVKRFYSPDSNLCSIMHTNTCSSIAGGPCCCQQGPPAIALYRLQAASVLFGLYRLGQAVPIGRHPVRYRLSHASSARSQV